MKIKIGIIMILILCAFHGKSQSFWERSEIGLGAGVMKYMGDVRNPYSKLAIQGTYTYQFNDHINFRGQLLFGSLGASDQSAPPYGSLWNIDENGHQSLNPSARPHSFNSKILETSVLAEYNLLSRAEHKWSPYGFIGLGYFNYFPKYNYHNPNTGQNEKLAWLRNNKNFNIPFGGGINLYLTHNFTLYGEANFRYTPVDDLDGLINTGNSKSKDYYYSFMLGFKYRFGGNSNKGSDSKGRLNSKSNKNCPPVYL